MSQRILVTGANRGIGLAIVTALLQGGHSVLAGSRQPDDAPELQQLQDSPSGQLHILPLDVTSDDSVRDACSAAQDLLPGLDVLINNAGVFPENGDEQFADLNLAHFTEAFATNVVGVARMIQVFTPLLEKGDNPRIINISSGAASIAAKSNHNYFAYATSKAALNMLTRALAAEYRDRGIAVLALTPGWVQTRMGGAQAPLSPEESGKAIAHTVTQLSIEDTSRFIERQGKDTSYGW